MSTSKYDPQGDVAKMMTLYGQEVKTTPDMPSSPEYLRLRARLVLEEAIEFVEALGCSLVLDGKRIYRRDIICDTDPLLVPNIVEAADAIGDILVVTYGGANALGVPARAVFAEVHRSNMSKVWEDGTIHKREDGKVLKPPTYSTAKIEQVLDEAKQEKVA